MPRQTKLLRPTRQPDPKPLMDPRRTDAPASRRDTLYSNDSTMLEEDDHSVSHHVGDEGAHADNSSNRDHEDDVFSDRSPRSSMGSVSSEADHDKLRSPQHYSGHVDHKGTTPRPPFQSPSSVKATHVSSPSSVTGGASRSARPSAIPTVSRIGSPSLSTQYSPKKTPPRFKKTTPPLVLLHVTLLPLRWPWGDILNHAQPSELSDEAKTLREAWRQLQDRNGDTIQDRGVLLPHPQNDFEMLEERLLEALELPLKRRARILECGHYLGPSNIMSFSEETESEDDDQYDDEFKSRRGSVDPKQMHWCATCASDIRFDALGPGKVYRVNVYASNGLLKAGAWGACWKEMERVDVELEPIVEPKILDELARLAAHQDKAMGRDRSGHGPRHDGDEDGEEATAAHQREPFEAEQEFFMQQDDMNDRRRMEEERWREVYGSQGAPRSSASFVSQQDHHARSEERFPAYTRNATFIDSLRETFASLFKDRKNIAIFLLSVFTVLFAVRHGGQAGIGISFRGIFKSSSVLRGAKGGVCDNEAVASSASHIFGAGQSPAGMNMMHDDPCAAVQPQTKWMTETVTQKPTSTAAEDEDEDEGEDADADADAEDSMSEDGEDSDQDEEEEEAETEEFEKEL